MKAVAELAQSMESTVLGALMQANDALEHVEFLTEEMFSGDNQPIYRAILDHADRNIPFDAVSLAETCGNMTKLAQMQLACGSPANIVHYAEMVRGNFVRRRVLEQTNVVISHANSPIPPDELVDRAQEAMMALAVERTHGPRLVSSVLGECVDALDARCQNPQDGNGVPTGFIDVDRRINGMQPGQLLIVAGRPAMGKTTWALNVAENASKRCPVAIFSLEMGAEELTDKLICSTGRVDYERYQTGALQDSDWPQVTAAVSVLADRKIIIDDTGSLSITQLRSRARKLHRIYQPGLLIVDYLQLMSAPADKEARRLGIGEISRGLKALAKELHIPVMALSQLSRSCEARPNKRPMLSDLRESGDIEQDADVVLCLYRDEVYEEDSPDRGIAEVLARKVRKGVIGTDRLMFRGHQSRFDNLAPQGGRYAGPAV